MKGKKPAGGQRERLLRAFFSFASERNDLSRTFARGNRLHPTDSVAVVAIIDAEELGQPLTPARLAEQVGLTGGATSLLLNRLEEVGYVQRVRGHADRRMVTLHSTPGLHKIAGAFFKPLRRRLETMMTTYSDEELQLVERFVADFRATMGNYHAEVGGKVGAR